MAKKTNKNMRLILFPLGMLAGVALGAYIGVFSILIPLFLGIFILWLWGA